MDPHTRVTDEGQVFDVAVLLSLNLAPVNASNIFVFHLIGQTKYFMPFRRKLSLFYDPIIIR